ncbi:site-specific integrase [Actinocorallia aurea]
MPRKTALAAPDLNEDKLETGRKKVAGRKGQGASKLRDGVMKRGSTWYYVIRVKDPETGVSKPKWVGGHLTEEDAKEARDEARVSARRGEYVERGAITVGDYLDEWLLAHAMQVKPRTLDDYQRLVRLYIKPRLGGMRLQAVRPMTVTKFYRDLLVSGGRNGGALSKRTVQYVHAVLCRAFKDAVEVDQLITFNPVMRAKKPRHRYAEPGTVWTPAQLRIFLGTARDHRLFAFFHLAAFTGARRGELLNLRWSDLDLDGAVLTVSGSVGVIAGQRVVGTTKSGRRRVVSLDAGTVAVLRAHKERQEAEAATVGEDWKGPKDGHVFATAWGEPIYPDTVTGLMRQLIGRHNQGQIEAGRPDGELPSAQLHDLRHIHATTLLLAGVPVHIVAARLGHADPAITLRVYAHVIRSAESKAADVFAGEVGDAC